MMCCKYFFYLRFIGNNLWLGRSGNFLSMFYLTVYEILMTDDNVVVAEWWNLKMVDIISDTCASLSSLRNVFWDWEHALQHCRQVVVENGILRYVFDTCEDPQVVPFIFDVCWWVIECDWIAFDLKIPQQLTLKWEFFLYVIKAKQLLRQSTLFVVAMLITVKLLKFSSLPVFYIKCTHNRLS